MKLKPSALAGWAVLFVFLLLTLMDYASSNLRGTGVSYSLLVGFSELAAFGVPTMFLSRYRALQGHVNLRSKPFPIDFLPFTLCMAFAISFLSFLLSYFSALPGGSTSGGVQALLSSGGGGSVSGFLLSVVTVALIPAMVEEFFMRGAVFSLYERRGTATAVLLTSVSFAMLHSSPTALLSALAAGLGYAYLTYVTGSVWSAIFAHFLNNLYSLSIAALALNYSFKDYWGYFIAANIVLFFLFTWFSLRELYHLAQDDRLVVFRRAERRLTVCLSGAVQSTGFLLFAFCFVFRLCLILLTGV